MLPVSLVIALATAVVLAVTDYRTGTMPNVITLGSLLLALGFGFLTGGSSGLAVAAVGAIVCAAAPLALFFSTRGKALGGGDVKALAALGAWLGPTPGLEAEMLGFVLLAAFGFAREIWAGRGLALLKRSASLLVPAWRSLESKQGMVQLRLGPALALGTLVVCALAWEARV